MKKIAFVSTLEERVWAACEDLWAQTAIQMQKQGFDVFAHVLRGTSMAYGLKELERAGGHVTFRNSHPTLLRRIFNRISNRHLYSWLDQCRWDLVVITEISHFYGLGWMEACRKRGLPYVTVVHNACENFWPNDEMINQAMDAYQNAKKCFFVSQRVCDMTCKEMGIQLKNAQLFFNPVKIPQEIFPWPDTKTIKLACVARLNPEDKGQDLLFEVLALPKWRSRPLEVTLWGDGNRMNSLKRLKAMLKLDHVHFGGFIHRTDLIWKNHHALILPSRHEGAPLVMIEAMFSKRPCITTDVGNCATVIKDNVTGFIAKAPTVDLIDEALERAWQKREEWESMGEAAARDIDKIQPKDPVSLFMNELIQVCDE